MKKLLNLILIILFIILSFSISHAITVTASPNPAILGQNVTININATFPFGTPSCWLEINYGDTGTWFDAGFCSSSPCNLTSNHSYNSLGTYTITVRDKSCTGSLPGPPDPATTLITIQPGPINLSVNPSSIKISGGQSKNVNLSYQFNANNLLNTTLSSSKGRFILNSEVIETNSKSLTVNIKKGYGTVSEIVNVPIKVIERVLRQKQNNFIYTRNFADSGSNISLNGSTTFHITTDATADFDINRIELYFENRRAEITIPKNYKGLKAFVDIKFTGSGLLKGYWEVDGRILSYVNQHITYGKTVTLQTPEIPPLPTFEPGTHTVKFVITSPSVDIPLPTMLYFVTTQEVRAPVKIELISPQKSSELDYVSQKFTWERLDGTMIYLIQFFENKDSNPIFSAYTKDAFYNIPDFVLMKIFQPGKTYFWKVIGFDDSNNQVGESNIWDFSFIKTVFVPGQIIIGISRNDFSENFIEEIKRKYGVEVLEFFSLESLNSVMVLLRTDRNIFDKISEIKSESKIILVQPNYIFQTLSEPFRKMQYAFDLMKIEKLHTFFKGRGVKVAVVDTGIDYDHKDLKDRVVYRENFVKGDSYKKEIHGTAVAGVIGASINEFGISGVAPETNIYSLRACEQMGDRYTGRCQSLSIARAMDEAIKKNVNVINMSFGTSFYDSLIASLIEKACESGIYITAPVSKIRDKISFPASHPRVLSVGGIDEKGKLYPSDEVAEKAKFLAPAENIFTTFPNNKHNFLSGTSLSSAYISGLLALYVEKSKNSNHNLPQFKGDICKWEEELFGISLCD